MQPSEEEEERDSRGRKNAFGRDWTEGNVFRNLVALSWPIVVSNSLNLLGPVIDMIWVGKLGAAAIAGVGVSSMAVMVINSARMGLTQGTRALVSRFIGSGDTEGANHVSQQAFVVSAGYVVVMASIGIFLAEPVMNLFGLEADVVKEGAVYMRVLFVGSIAMSFRMMAQSIMQASGDTVTPMRITVFFRIFHAALSPLLIFGLWIFPRMGVSGAAATNVISQGIGGTIGLWVLFSGRSRLRLSLRNFRLDPGVIWRILKIGIPASIMGMERSLGNIVLMLFVTPFGTLAVAGHALMQRIEGVLRMPTNGLGVGAGVLAGQNLGAGQPDRAEKSGWMAVGIGEVFGLIAAIGVFVWAEQVIRVFNTNPGVVEVSSSFLRIAAAGYLSIGIYFVLQQCISGTGDTMPPMLIAMLNFWLVQISLAYLLPKYTDLGVLGVRWAIVAGMFAGAIAYAIYFRLGRWKSKRL